MFWSLAAGVAGAPALATAQYSQTELGEYLHYAMAAANGGTYAGIDGIGYTIIFGTPSLYQTGTGWGDLPVSQGFDAAKQIYGSITGISHDGSVVAGSVTGTTPNGVSKQVAAYWVDGAESIVPAPPDDPGAITVSATGVSGDGTALLVQDGTPYSATVESFVFNIASGTFTSLGFLGSATHQTYATAINRDGTVIAGYSSLDNGNISGFIWTPKGVTVLGIPANHPNTFYLEPSCISDDGMTLYGRLTEGGGWVGFRYNTTSGYQDIGLTPSACTADGMEVVGIENLYFPAVWSASNGGGYLDHLLSANGITQSLGTTEGPVTISPDGSAITALGPDAYLTDQIWYGTWQILLPSPLKTAAIPPATLTFTTDYQTTLAEPAGTLTQYAEFNLGVSATVVRGPHYASSFVLNADGSFSYTPKPGYVSAGLDPETGTPTDTFTYQLVSQNGTSANAQVQITVLSPMPPTVANPTYFNLTATSATLGGAVTDTGGETVTAVGVVYAPSSVTSNPQIGDGVSLVAQATVSTLFTVRVGNLLPNTTYSYVAYATNGVGIGYSTVDSFTTLGLPVAGSLAVACIQNSSATVSTAKLLHVCSDPNGLALSVTAVSSPSAKGGAVSLSGSTITYTPAPGFVGADSFAYTVTDSDGLLAQGTVNVTLTAPSGNGTDVLGLTVNPDGSVTVRLAGIPGFTYQVQASTDLVTWVKLGTFTAGPNGLFQLTDTHANQYPQRYYRASAP